MPATPKPVRAWPQVRVFRELLRADVWVREQARAFIEAEIELSLSEFDMIAELGNQTAMRMSDLATKMVISPASVTRVAQSLAAKGFVTRERAEHSEREATAGLTPAGEALFQRTFPIAATFMAGLIDSQLTRTEQEKLAELLEKLGRSGYPREDAPAPRKKRS